MTLDGRQLFWQPATPAVLLEKQEAFLEVQLPAWKPFDVQYTH